MSYIPRKLKDSTAEKEGNNKNEMMVVKISF